MKLCLKCQTEKSETEFGFKDKKKNTLHSSCKECNKKYQKKHYRDNKQDYSDKAKNHARENLIRNRKKVREYLESHPCVDCGETDPVVLQFDHVRGEKTKKVSQLLCEKYSWDVIQQEIDKCDIRCANCHTRKTCKDFGWYRYLDEAS